MSILKAFNNHLIEFLEDISTIFPKNRDIRKSITALEMITKTNPKAVIVLWKRHVVLPYREKIMNGDLTFFINKDYNGDFENNGYKSGEFSEIIENLKKDVSGLDENNQNKAIKYVQNLTKLSELYQ